MSKKIVSSMLILVFALNIFVAAVNATCDQQYPPETDDIFPIDGAYLYLYNAGDNVKVEGTITYNYPHFRHHPVIQSSHQKYIMP